jgi:selenide, water dikinase
VLRPVESVFNPKDYPDLLIGLESPDDAAVWRVDATRALVMTTDFFTPVVDDAYDYGAIAAANSLSDIYAMGGQPFLALNIAALPPDLPVELTSQILLGGAEKAREAGVVIAGGHTVQDKEPKYGLVVVGFVNLDQMLTKNGIRPGDRLVLTKPLGFGVTTTALKRQKAVVQDVAEVVGWMKRLNQKAGQLANRFGLKAGTDITGFSLLGHSWEMAHSSVVRLSIEYQRLPFVSCARRYAEMGTFPGGASDNKLYYGEHVKVETKLDEAAEMLLFDPQTSGGLLLAVPPEKLDDFMAVAKEMGQPAWEIGAAEPGEGIRII